jgi:hypothetical protein
MRETKEVNTKKRAQEKNSSELFWMLKNYEIRFVKVSGTFTV